MTQNRTRRGFLAAGSAAAAFGVLGDGAASEAPPSRPISSA